MNADTKKRALIKIKEKSKMRLVIGGATAMQPSSISLAKREDSPRSSSFCDSHLAKVLHRCLSPTVP